MRIDLTRFLSAERPSENSAANPSNTDSSWEDWEPVGQGRDRGVEGEGEAGLPGQVSRES